MNKLIILTTSIIRGDSFHSKSIGKFYDYFYKYLSKYEIYHIINIDEPEELKKYFNKYETMFNYNKIIPEKVNKIYINEPNQGFLQAYKKIILKIEELGLIDDSYLYYWLEDDWEPKIDFDITILFNLFNFPNSAFTPTDRSPLGSFRGGPYMLGSYFNNIFNIKKYMNGTCDPERQMQRWLRGGNQKNGDNYIHRLSINVNNVQTDTINIIIVFNSNLIEQINLSDLNTHHYKSGFDKTINFNYHILSYYINGENVIQLKYSEIIGEQYNLMEISIKQLQNIFNNNSIKYFIIKPSIMFDIGRHFNSEFNLEKWTKIEDNTSYADKKYYNANLGNWKVFNENELRLKIRYTMNKGFFSSIAYIHQCLPYLEKNYFNQNININLCYYSHNYGSYPNFRVFGNSIQLNYIPTVNKTDKQFEELSCLSGLCKKICGMQISNENTELFYSYMNDFKLANYYWFKYFKFSDMIKNQIEKYVENNFNGFKILGLHFRATDKNKVNWVEHISTEEFLEIVNYHLSKSNYDKIFISTDDNNFIDIAKEKYEKKYTVLYYDDLKNKSNNDSIHLDRLKIIEELVEKIKKNKNDICKLVELENKLKEETVINQTVLEDVIINSLILSRCNCVVKTHSQVSAYAKIFNPDLEIYRINSCIDGYWPDSHIELYNYESVDNQLVKNLLKNKLSKEFDYNKKYMYKKYL